MYTIMTKVRDVKINITSMLFPSIKTIVLKIFGHMCENYNRYIRYFNPMNQKL